MQKTFQWSGNTFVFTKYLTTANQRIPLSRKSYSGIHLKSIGLANSSCRIHLAILSTCHLATGDVSICSYYLLRRLFKALANLHPPVKATVIDLHQPPARGGNKVVCATCDCTETMKKNRLLTCNYSSSGGHLGQYATHLTIPSGGMAPTFGSLFKYYSLILNDTPQRHWVFLHPKNTRAWTECSTSLWKLLRFAVCIHRTHDICLHRCPFEKLKFHTSKLSFS